MTDLSLIILNYNTAAYLKTCLNSIKPYLGKNRHYQIEIIVVDNHSSDQSVSLVKKRFPWVKLIANQKNLGFAAGNNVGLKKARGRYVMLLNSDTKILNNIFPILIRFMDQTPQAGAVTPALTLTNGKLDPASHRGFPTPWAALTYFIKLEALFPKSKLFARYHQGWHDRSQIHQVDAISGAAFFFRRQLLKEVGYFDDRFFFYAEDLDYCYRLKQQSYQIYFHPQAHVLHYKKRSGRAKKIADNLDREIRNQSRQYFYQTMKLFYDKHYQQQYPAFLRHLILAGIWIVSKLKN